VYCHILDATRAHQALLFEALQFLASNRDPFWTDVGKDVGGAALGVLLLPDAELLG
jgi:hypothetical protein